MLLNKEKTIENFIKMFGKEPDGFPNLIDSINKSNDFSNKNQLAYFLATIKWETAHTFLPIIERGGYDYFEKRYGCSTRVGKQLGNVNIGDGARYCGRGHIQLTGLNNYYKFSKILNVDLVNEPFKTLDFNLSYQIASLGMRKGLFTGKKLDDFINDNNVDFVSARKIVNGTDRAQEIAAIANEFIKILVIV